MAKKQLSSATPLRPSEEGNKRRQVNLDEDLFRKGGMVAAARGVSLPDLVNNLLRPAIERELESTLKEMNLDR